MSRVDVMLRTEDLAAVAAMPRAIRDRLARFIGGDELRAFLEDVRADARREVPPGSKATLGERRTVLVCAILSRVREDSTIPTRLGFELSPDQREALAHTTAGKRGEDAA